MSTRDTHDPERFQVLSNRTLRLMSSRRRLFATAAGVSGAVALGGGIAGAAPSVSRYEQQRAQEEVAIIIGTLGEASSINPFNSSADSETGWRVIQLFDELLRIDPQTFAPLPGIAKEWALNDLEITLTLQDNVKFSDGSDLTADDVAFTILGNLLPDTASLNASKFTSIDGAAAVMDGSAKELSGVKVVDPKTLTITLSQPDAAILYNLRFINPVPKAQLEGKNLSNDPWFQAPVGAGPFKFQSWTTDADFVMTRNEHYFEANKPAITKVTHRVIADAQSLVLALLNNEIDGSNYPSPTGKAELEKNTDLSIMVPPFNSPNGWIFNTRNKPLDDKNVRKAIAMALNNEQFASDSLLGLGKAGLGPLAPGSWAYDKDLKPIPFDVDGAKKLVQDAGAEGAQIRFTVNAGNIQREDWLTFTQQGLQAIGLEVVPEAIEYATLVERVTVSHDYDASNGDFAGATAQPTDLYEQFHSKGSSNHSGFSTPELDKLLEQARTTIDQEAAKPIWDQIQGILMDEVPVDWAWYRPFLHTVNKKWQNVTDSANDGLFYTLKDWTL
ncbi:MAG TPA: ABC transporter substrate-binding protein [Thermomicrobiales bacterium]|nr:ABC transporter substrate-binding protein [Thermomicrobiales bacterium]